MSFVLQVKTNFHGVEVMLVCRSAKLRTDCWFTTMGLVNNLEKGIFYGGIGTLNSEDT